MQRKFRALSAFWRNILFLFLGLGVLALLAAIKSLSAPPKPTYTIVEKSEPRYTAPRWALDNQFIELADHSFYLTTRPVTAEQYHHFVKATSYSTFRERHGQTPTWRDNTSGVVLYLTQSDAEAFCQWLSNKLRLPCRLPTTEELAAAPLAQDLWEWSSNTLADFEDSPGNRRYHTAFKAAHPLHHRRSIDSPNATFRVAWDLL